MRLRLQPRPADNQPRSIVVEQLELPYLIVLATLLGQHVSCATMA